MSNKSRYDLHFDFGESRNSEILNDEEEYEKFKDDLKSKLSKDYNIPKEKIIVTCLQKGSVRVQVIFQSDEFNNLDKKEFLNKFKNEKDKDFKELNYLKEIHTDVIMSGCKLSKDHNIPPEKIIVTLPQKGSFHVQVIFQSDEFNNLDKKEFIEKFKNDPEFKELSNLKDIHEDVIMGGVKLRADMLDPAGNRNDGWGIGEQRGGKDYDPPIGWNGIGLKVTNKFDNGDNTWI
jgi:hypothetical protein